MTTSLDTRIHDGVPDALAQELATWRSAAGFEALAAPWTRLAAHANAGRIDVHTVEARRSGSVVAIGFVHVVRKLAIGDYTGGVIEGFTRRARRVGWTPLAFDVGYLEIPFANRPGVLVAPGVDDETRAEAWRAIVLAADRGLRVDALCVKGSTRDPIGASALAKSELAYLPFAETWLLELPSAGTDGPPSSEAWLASLSSTRRRHVRVSKRTFLDAGGTFETIEDPASIAEHLSVLFDRTLARARARGDLPLPMSADARLYRSLHAELGAAASVRVSRVEGEIVGFTLELRSHDTLFMRFVGLDYTRSESSGAYFASYADMIERAASEGRRYVDLGTGTGEVKQRVGARRIDTHYRVAFRRWLAPARPLLTRMLASRFGEATKSAPDVTGA
ncbi:MAG: GNAT family N-acetyltransferase [Deltaproteobacteria bacterium]|nr:GNAT family N-acetyltransferase [Deltaproteobacteria bacterium]